MTISILAYDEKSGTYGGAATTGSLCVGGWVLRGDGESGMSASQGSLPSTMWGSDVLDRMRAGTPADDAVAQITGADLTNCIIYLGLVIRYGQTSAKAYRFFADEVQIARHVSQMYMIKLFQVIVFCRVGSKSMLPNTRARGRDGAANNAQHDD